MKVYVGEFKQLFYKKVLEQEKKVVWIVSK